ncbi:transcriptional regulator GcvA [Paraburkholderia phenoliruptrix]|uniref:LysR family transcriptional regulator, glycine cleavage system transcriptional activator n=2 Tax=Paraburkholderia phenoliruptrix TaxID=252970 RepID=K0E1A2_9BURK|nr:transcriptional regulator GcvA [Paraburkholderia phenoliruptrix]AFT90203.1 LysR family transcriptional regulator, glycine cleavage system transcriptional activator [Paraburkholderia phenoliruptrix BR3459a]CAB4052586.1 Glycine cleavage system transcriptional activator [Paraburkholderia phenoliruptrix]
MTAPIFLNALRAFEASARHQSFSAAALELNVTPAAVGQLVRSLEEWLGVPLFHRGSGGRARLVPTDVALRALPDIRDGFDRLNLGFARLKEGSAVGVLTVTVSPAFAAKWLLPRIDRFQSAWPETDVRLDTSLKLMDFATQGIDIGVRYGAGNWPGLEAEKLMDEEVFPVCSPAFLDKHRRLRGPADLAGLTLIDDLSVDRQIGFVTWDAWLESVGKKTIAARSGLKINNSAAVLQAAIDGRGVALARSVLVRDDLAAGRLVRLFPDIVRPSVLAYYVVYRKECAALPRLVAFRDWLLGEACVD